MHATPEAEDISDLAPKFRVLAWCGLGGTDTCLHDLRNHPLEAGIPNDTYGPTLGISSKGVSQTLKCLAAPALDTALFPLV
jgi:hypothetical protein